MTKIPKNDKLKILQALDVCSGVDGEFLRLMERLIDRWDMGELFQDGGDDEWMDERNEIRGRIVASRRAHALFPNDECDQLNVLMALDVCTNGADKFSITRDSLSDFWGRKLPTGDKWETERDDIRHGIAAQENRCPDDVSKPCVIITDNPAGSVDGIVVTGPFDSADEAERYRRRSHIASQSWIAPLHRDLK